MRHFGNSLKLEFEIIKYLQGKPNVWKFSHKLIGVSSRNWSHGPQSPSMNTLNVKLGTLKTSKAYSDDHMFSDMNCLRLSHVFLSISLVLQWPTLFQYSKFLLQLSWLARLDGFHTFPKSPHFDQNL